MKKTSFLALIFLLKTILTFSQTKSVSSIEKSFWGIQTGFLGAWIHNESKIGNKFSLRSEIGLDASIWNGDYYNNIGILLTPVITIEPRYYYNIYKREQQQKQVGYNSGNFLTLKANYHPNWFNISNHKNIKIVEDFSIIPTWGMKRLIGKSKFNYETGFGIGYRYIFTKKIGYQNNESKVAANLHLRIGYVF